MSQKTKIWFFTCCHSSILFDDEFEPHYCPNCGAEGKVEHVSNRPKDCVDPDSLCPKCGSDEVNRDIDTNIMTCRVCKTNWKALVGK